MASCVDSMQSSITQTAEAIELKVSAQDIVSTLNSQLLISGNRIELNTDGKIIINGTNFKVDANGKITAKDATLSGTMTAGSDSSYKIELKNAAANFYYQGTKVGQIDISGQDLIEIHSDRRVTVGRNNTYISMPTDDHMYINARNDIIFDCSRLYFQS